MKTHRVHCVIFGYNLRSDLLTVTQAEELKHVLEAKHNVQCYVRDETPQVSS